MRFSISLLATSLLVILSPLTHAEAVPAPKPEPIPAVLGTSMGAAGPQSIKRQTTLCADPNYVSPLLSFPRPLLRNQHEEITTYCVLTETLPQKPINCANGYCCPYNTLCDGSKCDTVKVQNGARDGQGSMAARELALVLGVLGGVFAVM
ncbi:hypothetical protein BP5796_06126 [Coleophoma crateriformis]|uniref:Uncharacterized protein n=1 Tax=Coleophoma crateriformis TaxID=565419 RepID=A0A3D8RWR2_9HELO|nr:hypothetical protein BP5796_06126 [Coleophoma crateriformis]